MNARTDSALLEKTNDMSYHLNNSHLDAWKKKPSSSCAKSPPPSSAPPCCSRAAKDSLVMLKCAERPLAQSHRAGIPYPLLMIDTGHNFPEVTDFRDFARRNWVLN